MPPGASLTLFPTSARWCSTSRPSACGACIAGRASLCLAVEAVCGRVDVVTTGRCMRLALPQVRGRGREPTGHWRAVLGRVPHQGWPVPVCVRDPAAHARVLEAVCHCGQRKRERECAREAHRETERQGQRGSDREGREGGVVPQRSERQNMNERKKERKKEYVILPGMVCDTPSPPHTPVVPSSHSFTSC